MPVVRSGASPALHGLVLANLAQINGDFGSNKGLGTMMHRRNAAMQLRIADLELLRLLSHMLHCGKKKVGAGPSLGTNPRIPQFPLHPPAQHGTSRPPEMAQAPVSALRPNVQPVGWRSTIST